MTRALRKIHRLVNNLILLQTKDTLLFVNIAMVLMKKMQLNKIQDQLSNMM